MKVFDARFNPGFGQRGRSTRACGVALVAVSGVLLAGCGGEAPKAAGVQPGEAGVHTPMPAPAKALGELSPVRVRVHPLTRLERDAKGQLRLVCYLELADRWGHPCKWLGQARVELYRPSEATVDTGAGASGGGERQENVWNVDLADPELNARSYDWVTRTYRLELVGLPDWVERLQRGESHEPWATVRAYFLAADAGNGAGERRMESSMRLRRGMPVAEAK